jgi:DNA-binding beta-propeller fold protein YncE
MNPPRPDRRRAALALAASAWVAGCATPPDAAAPKRPPRWPAPPEQPRYVFEATLRNGASLQGEDASLKRLLAGEEDLRASFGKPFAVAAGRGRVFVTDTEGRRVFVFDVPRRRTYSFGVRLEGQLRRPAGIALDAQGRVYVVDTLQRRVVVYDALGLYLGHIDGAPWWVRPTAVAVAPQGDRIHVVDTGGVDSDSHHVFTHDEQGRLVRRLGRRGGGEGEFNLPSDAAVGPDGALWVLDAGNFRVQAFSAEGRFVRAFGSPGNGIGQLARPRGLAVDAEGLVYVADAMLCNVQVFSGHGALMLALGGRALQDMPGRWALPARVACDETARVYVVDQYLHKVEVLRKLGDEEGRRWLQAAPAGG